MESKPKRRRRIRFGIRGVLILTTVLAIVMAYVLAPLLDYSNQRGLAKTASQMGIKMKTHGYRFREFSVARSVIGYFKPELKVDAVYEFDASEANLTDDDVANLVGIRRLEVLDLSNTKITDKALESIAKFRDLTILRLNNTKLTDAGIKRLEKLPHLAVLDTTGTDVSYEQLKSLDSKIQPWTKVSFRETRGIGELHAGGFTVKEQRVGQAGGKDFSGELLVKMLPVAIGTAVSVQGGGVFTTKQAEAIGYLDTAETVWFMRADFQPGATTQWKKMDAMTTLRINGSNITDADLVEISRQTQLIELQIQECDEITEVGLLPLTKLENLELLLIRGCKNVDGTTASEFRKLLPDCAVSIAGR